MLSGTSTEPPYDATTVHFRFWLFDEPGAIVASLMELQRLGLPDRAFVRQRAPVEQSLEYPPGF